MPSETGEGFGKADSARVIMTAPNLTDSTLDLRAWGECGKNGTHEAIPPGDARSVQSKISFAAATINAYDAVIVDRGNDATLSRDAAYTRKRCIRGDVDRDVRWVETGHLWAR